jgi:hypothetical protein
LSPRHGAIARDVVGKGNRDVDALRVRIQATPTELDVVSILNRALNRLLQPRELAP